MNSTRKSLHLLFAILFCTLLAACSKGPKVEGDIEGADKALITLEKSDYAGQWIVVDSTRTSASGAFKFDIPEQKAPEIFRLALNDRYIYFPVDSTETVSVKTSLAGFDSAFSLDGSQDARNMAAFDHDLNKIPANANAEALHKFKRDVYTRYLMSAKGSVVAYYILTKMHGDKPLFNPSDPTDAHYFGAVATAFKQFVPDDPRTKLLEQTALEGMRKRSAASGKQKVVEAPQTSIIDINLFDVNNREVALSQVAAQGKPVVVVFSLMNQPESPEFNRALHKLWSDRNQSFNIYHVSFDTDLYAWRDAAINLPWTCVIDPTGTGSKLLASYNVQHLPAFFIINSRGELADKTYDIEAVPALLNKHQ